MKFLIYLSSIMLICSCISKQAKESRNNQLIDKIVLFDSLETNSYIGFVNKYYFKKSNEFYIELYLKSPKLSEKDFIQLAKSKDSIIYKDDENCRYRIPTKVASDKFDFSALKQLDIYDKNHNKLASADFVRIEYLDQNLSSLFTAVYRVENSKILENASYCVGNIHLFILQINTFNILIRFVLKILFKIYSLNQTLL